jgi:hypothetical protein
MDQTAPAIRLCALAGLLAAAVTAHAAGLNDTGIDFCRNHVDGTDMPVAAGQTCAPMPVQGRQDARFGADAAAAEGAVVKIGGGGKGFDFTKVANNGDHPLSPAASLGSSATDWACTYDNNTGLLWEVKTASITDTRGAENAYTWYDGVAGTPSPSPAVTCVNLGQCNTKAFIDDTNAKGLCGHHDWRLPTVEELTNLADRGRSGLMIDPNYFPNTAAALYWTSTPAVIYADYSWAIGFQGGSVLPLPRSNPFRVRLVRSGL